MQEVAGRAHQTNNGRPTWPRSAQREAYTEAMGPAPNVIETLRGFRQTARENAEIGFGKAFQGATLVDVSTTIKLIDQKLSPGITGTRRKGRFGAHRARPADMA